MTTKRLQQWVSRLFGGNAKAGHLQDENRHLVAFEALRVLICQDGDHWFAQGIDLDYAAEGVSPEDVKQRFERGLVATVRAHLERFGTIERLLKNPPPEAWLPLASRAQGYKFSILSIHDLPEASIPFRKLEFYIQTERQAA